MLPALLLEAVAALRGDTRKIVAIAGAPASGKSTLAEALVGHLNVEQADSSALLPMDGYHYDDAVLVPLGWRPRKGAPHTFDVGGLHSVLARLRANQEETIAVPRFDRDLEIARAGAALIPQTCQLIVVEGNYLLLDQAPWTDLRAYFDLTVFLDVPEATLKTRLEARWQTHGLSAQDAASKIAENDLPNAELVARASGPADIRL